MNLTTATPAEVDTALAALYTREAQAEATRAAAVERLHRYVGDEGRYVRKNKVWNLNTIETRAAADALAATYGPDTDPRAILPGRGFYRVEDLRGALATIDAAIAEKAAIAAEEAPLHAEYASRPWSRFFIVTSSNDGHIHSSMHCSTCRITTGFGWNPELSGKTEAEAVALLGPTLCTVCFPSAPLAWTQGAEKPASCPGSKTANYDRATARMGYYTGNYGTCNDCGERVTLTSSNVLRTHKPKA